MRPAHARLLLAHHFGLERFESLSAGGSGEVDEIEQNIGRVFQQTPLFGGDSEGRRAFILNVDVAVARGEFMFLI